MVDWCAHTLFGGRTTVILIHTSAPRSLHAKTQIYRVQKTLTRVLALPNIWEKLSILSAIVFGLTTAVNDTPVAGALDEANLQAYGVPFRAIVTLLILAALPIYFSSTWLQRNAARSKAETLALRYIRENYGAADAKLDEKRLTERVGDYWHVPVWFSKLVDGREGLPEGATYMVYVLPKTWKVVHVKDVDESRW